MGIMSIEKFETVFAKLKSEVFKFVAQDMGSLLPFLFCNPRLVRFGHC
jgi:hypothetical protein